MNKHCDQNRDNPQDDNCRQSVAVVGDLSIEQAINCVLMQVVKRPKKLTEGIEIFGIVDEEAGK